MDESKIIAIIKESVQVKQGLIRHADTIAAMANVIADAIGAGGKLLVFGNGGSAADAQHMAGELIGKFLIERRALPAVALGANSSIITSIGNDSEFSYIFERQIQGLAKKGDACLGISTSGTSRNVIAGIHAARDIGATTLALTGCGGGELAKICDISLVVDSNSTPRIQEAHIAVIHIICELVENAQNDKFYC